MYTAYQFSKVVVPLPAINVSTAPHYFLNKENNTVISLLDLLLFLVQKHVFHFSVSVLLLVIKKCEFRLTYEVQ